MKFDSGVDRIWGDMSQETKRKLQWSCSSELSENEEGTGFLGKEQDSIKKEH